MIINRRYNSEVQDRYARSFDVGRIMQSTLCYISAWIVYLVNLFGIALHPFFYVSTGNVEKRMKLL